MQLSSHILIVDDISENIQVAMSILKEDNYEFSYAIDGESALRLVKDHQFDLILLDIMMPGIDGFDVCRRLKNDRNTAEIPVIFLTAKSDVDAIAEGFKVGAVDYLVKPFHANELLARVKTHLELSQSKQLLRKHNLSLKVKVQRTEKRLLSELEKSQKEMIYVLTELMEFTSDETGKHIKRVAEHSRLLATLHPALSADDAEVIFHAAPMHDIGKVMIPDAILNKPGKYTPEEFEIMKTHTIKAHDFLKSSKRKIMKAADIIAYQHHEKWDGTGYPQGLKGDEIHLYGRIVALADVFDALSHKRVYKEAWDIKDTLEYIVSNRGTHFDPSLVDLLQNNLDEFLEIAQM